MPLTLHTSLSRHRRRKESDPRSQNPTFTLVTPAITPTNESTNSAEAMNSTTETLQGEQTRLSRLLAGANRLGKRAGTFPRFGRKRENATSATTTPASSAPNTPPTPASLTWPPAPVQWANKPTHVVRSEEPSVADVHATSRPSSSVLTASTTESANASSSISTEARSSLDEIESILDSVGPPPPIPPRRRSSLASRPLPQKCRYDPLTDMYIPVPNPLRVRTSMPPMVGLQPQFEIKSVIDPIQNELRDLADSAETRQQEKKAKFQERRRSQMEDMMVQFNKVEKEMQLLRGRLGSLGDEEARAESEKQESKGEEEAEEDEDSRKSRDSAIGMKDEEGKELAKRNDSASSSPVDEDRRRKRASVYWNSLRDDIRLNEESEEEREGETLKGASSSTMDDSPTRQSKARVQTWSPHSKVEAALNRPSSEQKKKWRESLYVPPDLKEQLGKRQSISGS